MWNEMISFVEFSNASNSFFAYSEFVSKFLEIESRNSKALSRDNFKSFSYERRSNRRAPDSVISDDS